MVAAEVQIIITDTNDNAPAIQPIRVTVLQEQSSEGTIITTVVANDPDQGDGGMVTYSILNQVDLPVSIDPNTGVITISEVIDREDISWVNFTVVVSDAGDPALTSTVDVNLRVTDINDNNPSFNQTIYVSMVNESSSVGECFTFIVASDADAGDFGAVTYTLSGGDGLFEISSETLIVDVTDTNEFAPTADPEFPFTLPEGEPPGTVVGEITAIDPDSPDTPLIYIISDIQPPGAEGIFTIDSETGEIILIGEIDSDNASFSDEYRINIIISDGGNPERTTTVVSVITIMDLNDTPPSFGQGYYNISVSEDFDTKNPVITLSATDPDENTALTYRITRGNEDSSFLISSDTGEIRLLGTFDHETRQLYELTVSVTDQGGLESTAVVDIHVTDVNDNEPRFTESLYQFSVCENEPTGFEIGRIQALDNDLSLSNNDIIYTILTGNEDGSLMLDPATGIITSTRPYDSEVEEGFTLTVEARNHRIQDGPITDTSVVSILIVDKNDNDPQFGRTDYSQNIRETETGTVDAIFATDIDSGVNGIVSYRIIEGNSLALFSIGETNGLLTLIRPISSLRDPVFEFQLVVEAFDMGNPSRSSNQTVVITVGDDNDRAPIFLVPRPGEVFELPENEPPGYFLVCLNATDRDPETTVKSSTNSSRLRPETGTTLVVLASDQGQPPRRTPLQIIIEVTDKADTDPEFPTDPDGTPVKQNLPPVPEGIATLTVLANVTRAVDPDLNSTIYYFIVSGNNDGLFEVHPTTGEIIVVGTLDFENQPTHTIVVKATNDVNFVPSGGPYDVSTDRTLKEVFISVTDINDNPHVFLDQLIVTGVPRDAPVDSAVITVSVNDPDANSVGNIMYRITRAVFISNQGGDPRTASGIFYIDEDTGTIRTNTRFVESDLDGFFELDIEAVDKETGVEVGTVVQIHVLESDQRVVLVIEDSVTNVRLKIDILRELLSNLTGGIVRIDDITAVVDENGNRIGQTMVFFHVVDRETNQIQDSGTVVRYNKFLGGGAAGAAGAARGQQLVITEKDSYDGRHNQGFDDTDFKKEYEYQEGIVNFDGEDMYVDQAHDALIMTSLVGKNSRRDNFAYGDGSSLNENGLIGEGGFHDNYFSEERTNSRESGLNRDGSFPSSPENQTVCLVAPSPEHKRHLHRDECLFSEPA
ncbi:hypothetical protein BSL78_03856 [Apostichopus japonicus]|uniref:Cadherin domain-containing protein n=1 Tax=Stichopus japonicus TaxID=307972 RepID=A0A2G8LG48_STIJA|nr:hypothetical protein BSL78_03856 [Apostichopus japonicus]